VLDVAAVRTAIEAAGAHAAPVLTAFEQAKAGREQTALLFRAVTGANRGEVLNGVGNHRQIAIKATGLLPVGNEDELAERWRLLTTAAKAASGFGPERRVNHAAAVRVGLINLAAVAGYADADDLELDMEARAAAEARTAWAAAGYDLRIDVDGSDVTLRISRDGKPRKSVPAPVRKTDAYAEARAEVERLRAQARRVRTMLERLLTTGALLDPDRLARVLTLAPARAALERLVLRDNGGGTGLLEAGGLRGLDGTLRPIAGPAGIAHPWHLLGAETLGAWQREIVRRRLVQPIKQVFRELYVVTPAERAAGAASHRFSGRVVDADTMTRLLAARGWTIDRYEGASKANGPTRAVIRILTSAIPGEGGVADLREIWFQPTAATLYDQATALPLDAVDPLVLSETMRDADLVVSVAGRGDGVSSSAEQVLRRGELVAALAADLGLGNVSVDGRFAHVRGRRASYRVHLASASIHLAEGGYVCVVPAGWGLDAPGLFLPFADGDDRGTAEVMSKVLLLAADDTITDPSIIAQIERHAGPPVAPPS
jgi:hypothetical protein